MLFRPVHIDLRHQFEITSRSVDETSAIGFSLARTLNEQHDKLSTLMTVNTGQYTSVGKTTFLYGIANYFTGMSRATFLSHYQGSIDDEVFYEMAEGGIRLLFYDAVTWNDNPMAYIDAEQYIVCIEHGKEARLQEYGLVPNVMVDITTASSAPSAPRNIVINQAAMSY